MYNVDYYIWAAGTKKELILVSDLFEKGFAVTSVKWYLHIWPIYIFVYRTMYIVYIHT